MNYPWLNKNIGQILSNSFDVSPNSTKILFVNLNIGSTYGLALVILVSLTILGYLIITITKNRSD